MSSNYTLPYDPALLLSRSTRIKLSGDNSDITLYKGAGESSTRSFFDGFRDEELQVESTTEKLFFIKDDVPTAFKPKGYYNYLTDGTAALDRVHEGDYDSTDWIETLAISQRNAISDNPLFLVNTLAYNSSGWIQDYEEVIADYIPRVLTFEDRYERRKGIGLREEDSISINAENNDYWEAAFEYDINQDGFIPEYRTFELYQRPTKSDVNGEVMVGKKKDEVLNGGKKDDHIDGKKGNDIVNGNNGNDALFGSKGRDQLYGSNGNDYLSGGSRDDILEGGSGADIFALSAGDDLITDFSLEDGDKIAVQGKHIGEFIVEATSSGSMVSVNGYGSLEVNVNLEGVDLVDFVVQSV